MQQPVRPPPNTVHGNKNQILSFLQTASDSRRADEAMHPLAVTEHDIKAAAALIKEKLVVSLARFAPSTRTRRARFPSPSSIATSSFSI